MTRVFSPGLVNEYKVSRDAKIKHALWCRTRATDSEQSKEMIFWKKNTEDSFVERLNLIDVEYDCPADIVLLKFGIEIMFFYHLESSWNLSSSSW